MSEENDLNAVVLPPVLPPLTEETANLADNNLLVENNNTKQWNEETANQTDNKMPDTVLNKEPNTLSASMPASVVQPLVTPSVPETDTTDTISSPVLTGNFPSNQQNTPVNTPSMAPSDITMENMYETESIHSSSVASSGQLPEQVIKQSIPQESIVQINDTFSSSANTSVQEAVMPNQSVGMSTQSITETQQTNAPVEDTVSTDTNTLINPDMPENADDKIATQQTKAAPPQDPSMMSLAEEIGKNHEADAKEDAEKQAAAANSAETSPSNEKINYSSQNFLKELFANGNECITAPGGSYSISDSTRSMLALFSNGRYFVAETHKYDGPPLLFVTDTKRRRLQIGHPEYVPLPVINSIYEYAAQSKSKNVTEVDTGNQEQARMQRDFVTIVSKAASLHVSDIHIIVADHTTVMFRINGLMQVELEYNKEWGESFVRAAFASADISDANYAQNEYQAAQKVGKTALRGSGGKLLLPRNVQGIRLQFNPIAFGTRYVVMRLLYDEENAESAGDLSVLGFEPQETEMFYRLRAVPTGIVIVAGPTGSGKSTTLQRNMISMLQERNYELNLITVEDPPEYPIPGARQMPVTNAATEDLKDREFTKALSASLRSDPDALMIGEIRTLSAADLAFRGALSGHNVWTTLHANSAPAILMRLKDMGVEDFKLQDPSIMKGLLSQRLFRKICPYCRVSAKDQWDNPVVQRLYQAFGDIGVELSYLRGPGCKHCEFRGVKGRTVVGEFILPDATFLDLMLRGESKKALDYWVTELNGRTLKEAAQSRMLKGIIDIEEVERWTGLFNDA